eukprot:scaffold3236_cov66-Cylindrotheca_fusiformis.AAC.32
MAAVAQRNISIPPRGAQKPLQAVPSVMFNEHIKVVKYAPEEEKEEDVWYTRSEYYVMRRQAKIMAKKIETVDCEGDCSRGLEIVESKAVQKRSKLVQELVQNILRKQYEQADPEVLAETSREVSSDSLRKSLENAHSDAKQAKQYLKDIRKDWGRNGKPSPPKFLGLFPRKLGLV